MSSTNRGYERHKTDYYVTPVREIEKFLTSFNYNFNGKKILDPCAGGDEAHGMSYPDAFRNLYNINIDTNDIREDSLASIKSDYLDNEFSGYDVIITNPPFFCATEIIEKALQDVNEGGVVIMLLRLNFFGSKERNPFFKNNMPTYCFVHSKRMSFTGDKATDSIEYMHAVWIKGSNPEFSNLKVLDYE